MQILRIKKYLEFVNENINEGQRKNYTREGFKNYPYQMYFSDNGMSDAVGANSVKELIDNVAVPRKLMAAVFIRLHKRSF
jgi:hypothetical protein